MQAETCRPFSANSMLARVAVNAMLASPRHQLAMRGVLVGLMLPPAVVAVYLVKSALGINLLPGPSPLHDLFYHFVR